jgi:hypothetical protein
MRAVKFYVFSTSASHEGGLLAQLSGFFIPDIQWIRGWADPV